jgi:putative lipoic acid-binding regulatory protein
MTNVQDDQAPAKRQKMLKIIRKFIHEDRRRTIHELANTTGNSYGVCLEILAENSSDNATVHTSLKTTEFVTNNNMVIVPHPPYSPDLAPCDFALFPNCK